MATRVLKKRGIARFYQVRFTADEAGSLRLAFHGLPDPETLIEEIRLACDCAMGNQPDFKNRNKRLVKMHAAVVDFYETLREIQNFAYDNLQVEGRKNEIAATASQILPHLSRLQSLLGSTVGFYTPSVGRKQNERALVLARAVKSTFERFSLPVSRDKAGPFFEVLCICLKAIRPLCADGGALPTNDPSRLIKTILDETR